MAFGIPKYYVILLLYSIRSFLHERRRGAAAFFTGAIDLIISLFRHFKKSVLYLTSNATSASRRTGIFGSTIKFPPGVGTIHFASFGVVKKI